MATISDDLFTTADGAVLSGRTSTGGQTWTKKALDLGDFTVFSNKIYWNHASGYDIFHLSGNATTDGEYAEAVWDVKTLIGLVGIGLRFSPGANVGYFLGYASSASTWRLYRFDGGFTVLASGGSAPGTGTRTVRLTATGTGASVTLRCQLDGADIFSPYVDSSASRITTLGRLMIYGDTLASSTTGIHIDSVKLEDGGAGGTDATGPGATVSATSSLLAGSANASASATAAGRTLTAASSLLYPGGTLGFQAAGMEFGARTGLGISTFALENGVSYRYTVHADGLTLGAALYTSGAITLDGAGKLPNLSALSWITPGALFRVHAIRQSDGEAATFRMRALA